MTPTPPPHGSEGAGAGFRYPRRVTPTSTRPARWCGALLVAAALPVLAAAPAHAEIPEGWSDPDEVSLFQLLVVIAGIPLVLFVVITLAVVLPALTRGEKLLPSTAPPPDEWFGGPDRPAGEVESRSRELGSTGGASGSW